MRLGTSGRVKRVLGDLVGGSGSDKYQCIIGQIDVP